MYFLRSIIIASYWLSFSIARLMMTLIESSWPRGGRQSFLRCNASISFQSLVCNFSRHLRVAVGSAAMAIALEGGTVAWAAPITFAFSGSVTSSDLGVAPGTTVSGLYTFESTTTDSLSQDATEGRYFSTTSDSGWYVQVGSSILTTQPSSVSRVATQVFDNHVVNGTPYDGYLGNL